MPDDSQEKGQKLNVFNVFTANWDQKDSNPTLVFWGNYTNAHGVGESNERLVQLAHQMPEYALFAIDHPGFGDSDKMTCEQVKKGFLEVVDSELRVMKELGIKEVILDGQSMGAFTALAVALKASEYEIKVKKLILEELPGFEKLSTLELGKRVLDENSKLDIYHGLPESPRMIKAAGLLLSNGQCNRDALVGLTVPFRVDPFFRYARAMAKGDAGDWARELFKSPQIAEIEEIVFMNGNDSTVSPDNQIQALVDSLREVKNGAYKDRINRVIFPGFGHLATVNAPVHAANIKLTVTSHLKSPAE